MNNLYETLELLVPVVRSAGEKIKRIRPAYNCHYADGVRIWASKVAEVQKCDGDIFYVNIEHDSELAAVADIIAVIQGDKVPVEVETIEYILFKDGRANNEE